MKMQVGKITFNDTDEIKLAINGAKHYYFILDLDNQLRSWIKHGNQFQTIDEALERVRKMIHEEVDLEMVR